MGIKPTFDQRTIDAYIKQEVGKIRRAIIFNLTYLGEQCVTHARKNGTYLDQTGNLRNSVGYIIIDNGKVLKSNFERTASVKATGGKRTTKGSADGVRTGREYAKEVASKYPRGLVLIVVAGMNYAASVESKGRDVLQSAEKLCELEMPKMIKQLKLQIAA